MTFDIGEHDGNARTTVVQVVDDLFMEGTENVILYGSAQSPASFVGGPVTINILDDDCKCVWLKFNAVYHLFSDTLEGAEYYVTNSQSMSTKNYMHVSIYNTEFFV